MKSPKVSVIYLTKDRKKDIIEHLTLLKGQTYKNFEIILVDNDSIDGTRELVKKKFPHVRLLHNSPGIGRAGHNSGMLVAKGEIFLTIDSDMYLPNDGLKKIVEKFTANDDLFILALQMILTYNGDRQVPTYLCKGDSRCGYPSTFGGGMVAMRKEVFERVGGWDPFLFLYAEEWEYHVRLWRAGYVARYFPDVFAYHKETPSAFRSEMKGHMIARNWLIMYMLFLPIHLWPRFFTHHLYQLQRVITKGTENRKGTIAGIIAGLRDMLFVLPKRKVLRGEVLDKFLTFYFPEKGKVVVEQFGWSLKDCKIVT